MSPSPQRNERFCFPFTHCRTCCVIFELPNTVMITYLLLLVGWYLKDFISYLQFLSVTVGRRLLEKKTPRWKKPRSFHCEKERKPYTFLTRPSQKRRVSKSRETTRTISFQLFLVILRRPRFRGHYCQIQNFALFSVGIFNLQFVLAA
jgi:hypothetical protein